jgi:hypothetical protein
MSIFSTFTPYLKGSALAGPFFCDALCREPDTQHEMGQAPLGGGRSLADQSVDLVHRFCAVLRKPPSSAVLHPYIRNNVPSLCSAGKTAPLVCRTPPAQQHEDIFENIDQYTFTF